MWESGAHTTVRASANIPGPEQSTNNPMQVMGLRTTSVLFKSSTVSAWSCLPAISPRRQSSAVQIRTTVAATKVCVQDKHSGVGHKDIGYSYVVIQRGSRPPLNSNSHAVGKAGPISYEEAQKDTKRSALVLYPDAQTKNTPECTRIAKLRRWSWNNGNPQTPVNIERSPRGSAYHWPRLVFPPIKCSGHIILDSCTPSGRISHGFIPLPVLTVHIQAKSCLTIVQAIMVPCGELQQVVRFG